MLECAAVGVPSELIEEDTKVYIRPRPGSNPDAETIWRHCEATMAPFQIPRFITFVDQLPKTPTGGIGKPDDLKAREAQSEIVHDREALATAHRARLDQSVRRRGAPR